MAENTQAQQAPVSRRQEKIGYVVSNKMAKTIVVEVVARKAHPKYGRIVRKSSKFYAHDDQNRCHVGDVVRIRETRPLSKLKRWELVEVLRQEKLAAAAESNTENAAQ
jgi:small subunit ribosomal protein S17